MVAGDFRGTGTGMTGATAVERLRQYLRDLSPEARALLLAELERGALGERNAALDMILDELRTQVRRSNRASERLDAPDRRFFLPLEPFLVDDEIPERISGRVPRAALPRVWTWIERDLIPGETESFLREARTALATGNTAEVDKRVHDFQGRALAAIEKALTSLSADPKARQRLAAQLGGERAFEALAEIIAILHIREALHELALRLPEHIKNLADGELDTVRALFDVPAVRRPDVFPYALVLLLSRLASPIQLLRLATATLESDSAKRIGETPFAFAIDLVIDETSRTAVRLARDLRGNFIPEACADIKRFHDLARGLAGEIDLSDDTRWGKRLSHLRADTAALLRSHIDGLPGQVRRLLRPRSKEEIGVGAIDPHHVADVEGSLEVLRACRAYAAEVAVSEITLRVTSELESCLDNATQALLDSVRNAPPDERPFRVSQLNAAVRFAGKIFGRRYAELLAKAAEVAIQSERRAAQG